MNIPVLKALLWQHNNAEGLTSLITSKQNWLDENHAKFWNDWFNNVFALDTANAFGLQVWGIILGVPIGVGEKKTIIAAPVWGFGEFNKNFNRGNFANADIPGGVLLSVDEARALLKLRYYYLISRPCADRTNEFLKKVFPEISCVGSTTMGPTIYNFKRPVSPQMMALMLQGGILPAPAAVGFTISVMGRPVFGFSEYNENFNNGTFASF